MFYGEAMFIKCLQRISLDIGIMVREFANGPGDLGSIPGRVIPKYSALQGRDQG